MAALQYGSSRGHNQYNNGILFKLHCFYFSLRISVGTYFNHKLYTRQWVCIALYIVVLGQRNTSVLEHYGIAGEEHFCTVVGVQKNIVACLQFYIAGVELSYIAASGRFYIADVELRYIHLQMNLEFITISIM